MILILAPRYLHKSILKQFRENDPFCDVKLVSKEELQKYCYSSFKEESLFYLMKNYHYNYETSKMLLEYMPYIDSDIRNFKMDTLSKLYDELKNADLVVEPIKNHNIYKNREIIVIGYSSLDKEISNLLNKINCEPTFLTNKKIVRNDSVFTFDKAEDEVYFVLNKIAALLDSGVSIKDIYILKRNSDYDYYLNKFAPEFGYQINMKPEDNYSSLGAFKEFCKLYEESHDIASSLASLRELMKDDERYLDLEDAIEELNIKDLDFELQKDYLYHKLSEKRIYKPVYDQAVEVTNNPIYGQNKYVFVLGFAQGQYPKSIKDDKYLNNQELSLLNLNNAKDKTKIDEDILMSFFSANNQFTFTFSFKTVTGKFYLSPLAKQLGLVEQKGELSNEFYSEKVLTYLFNNLLDISRLYNERHNDYYKTKDAVKIAYNCYDNSYHNKVDAFNEKSFLKLSTTRLDLFSNCPFHYYLSKVVRLDEDEASFYVALGNISHTIFEHHREENFDFNTAFDEEMKKYDFLPSEKLLLERQIKKMIEDASKSILKREQYYKNPKIYNEIELEAKLDDNLIVSGRVDNLVTLDDKYLVCIDYKTGSSSSNFKESKFAYGLSTQLPTYTLLASRDEKFSEYQVMGIYINHVIPDTTNNLIDENELIYNYLKLQGKTLADIDAISAFDSTIADGKSSFIASVKLKKDMTFDGKSAVISDDKFLEYKVTVENYYLDMASRIRNNDFPISPLYISKNENACQYCPFKDICYVKPNQRKLAEGSEDEEDE